MVGLKFFFRSDDKSALEKDIGVVAIKVLKVHKKIPSLTFHPSPLVSSVHGILKTRE